MSSIGRPLRTIIVEPLVLPAPLRQPAEAPPPREPIPVPVRRERVPA